MNMKAQNQATAILAGLNKFNKKNQTWMVLTKKSYLNNFLRIFEKLLVVITSQQNSWKPCFLQYCWVRKHLAIPFNVENKALIANYRNPKKAFRLILFIIGTYQYQLLEGGHSLSTYAKFSEKLTFNPLIRTRSCQGVRNVSFSENFAYVLNGWSQVLLGTK